MVSLHASAIINDLYQVVDAVHSVAPVFFTTRFQSGAVLINARVWGGGGAVCVTLPRRVG